MQFFKATFLIQVQVQFTMIPGVLSMDNCKEYTLSVYPDSFPSLKNDSRVWDEGFSHSFAYETAEGDAPDIKNTTGLTLATLKNGMVTVDIEKVFEFISCKPELMRWQTKRSLAKNNSSDELSTVRELSNTNGKICLLENGQECLY